jgi:hypothetical protein
MTIPEEKKTSKEEVKPPVKRCARFLADGTQCPKDAEPARIYCKDHEVKAGGGGGGFGIARKRYFRSPK